MRRALALCGAVALAFGGGLGWFVGTAPTTMAPGETDGVAVLTGGPDRVRTGLQLLAEGQAKRLILSGVARTAELGELARLAEVPVAPLEGRVTLGRAAATTRGNAAEIAAWAVAQEVGSIRVVTSAMHMRRALLELRRALPEHDLRPHPVRPAATQAGTQGRTLAWLREYCKYLGALAGLTALLPAREGARAR